MLFITNTFFESETKFKFSKMARPEEITYTILSLNSSTSFFPRLESLRIFRKIAFFFLLNGERCGLILEISLVSFQQSQFVLYALNGLIVDNRFKLHYLF